MDKNFWDINAKNWAKAIELKTIASRLVTNKALVDVITQKKISSVFDTGCGEGWLAAALKPLGLEYFGIDGSAELVQIAQSQHGAEFAHVTYDDILHAKWKPSKLFDAVCFNFALFDETISSLLKNVSSFIKPDGFIIIQTLHPLLLSPYQDGWRVENFEAMKIPFQGTMNWYGRTLESWTKEFNQAQLVIESIHEPMNGETPASILFTLKRLL